MAINAIVLYFGDVIKNVPDADLGLRANNSNRPIRDKSVEDVLKLARNAAEKYADNFAGNLNKNHPSFVGSGILEDGEVHCIADGIGKTYVQFAPEDKKWCVWRNNEDAQVFSFLAIPAQEGLFHLATKVGVEKELKRIFYGFVIEAIEKERERLA